jgi:3'(2'), 5'-bisphosphate nucleotidase
VHVIVEEAGGKILDSEFAALSYNQRDTLANPDFMVMGQASIPWPELVKARRTERNLTD